MHNCRDTDEPANLLALRLPGLGSIPGKPGAREFIDLDFADAAASGDLKRYIEGPFVQSSPLEGVAIAIGGLGREMATAGLADVPGKISIALAQSSKVAALSGTSADLISILLDHQSGYQGDAIAIVDAHFETIVVDPELNFSSITLTECTIGKVELARSSASSEKQNSIRFNSCAIDKLEGAVSAQDVPAGILVGSTSVESYTAFSATNGAVMRTALPDPVKVLLTILRKLFMQRGTGRQYGALRRGLPLPLIKYVDPVIAQIKTQGFAEDVYLDRRPILIPNRSRSADALAIINGPNTTSSPLMERVRAL